MWIFSFFFASLNEEAENEKMFWKGGLPGWLLESLQPIKILKHSVSLQGWTCKFQKNSQFNFVYSISAFIREARNPDFFSVYCLFCLKNMQYHEILIEKTNPDILHQIAKSFEKLSCSTCRGNKVFWCFSRILAATLCVLCVCLEKALLGLTRVII